MRKLLTILGFLMIGFVTKAQFPFTQTVSNASTLYKIRGGTGVDSALVFVVAYTDTTNANLGWLDNIAGAVIRTSNNKLWLRNNDRNTWIEIGSGGGGGGTVTQFNFTDGSGFDGTVINATTTPTLSLTTTVGNGQVHYTTTGGAVAGSANLTYDASLLTALSAGLGATQDDTKGVVLINTTAAAAGAQQISPSIRWSGQGWKTTATAASQEVEYRAYVLPIQGTSNPTASWIIQSSINAAAYETKLSIRSDMTFLFGTGTSTVGNSIAWLGSSVTGSGSINLSTNASTASSNTFLAAGQNTVIDAGANGSHSLATDGHIYAGALYAFIANDANEAWGESAAVFGFGNDVYDDNGFSAGSDNDVGHTSSGLFSNGFAIGTGNATAGNTAGALGANNTSSAANAITIGRSNTSSATDAITIGRNTTTSASNSVSIGYGGAGVMTNSEASSFAVGFNSTVPSFRVSAGSGAGTYGQTYIYGAANFGIAGTTLGSLKIHGNTSGTVTIQPQAAAGTYTMILPNSNASGALTNDGSGNLSWSAGGGSTWNGITDPTGDQALTFQAGESSTWTDQNTTEDLFTVNNATSTTNSLFSYNRTSTALASGNNIMELVSSGANGTGGITSTVLSISNTNTGSTSVNVGINITASGATTNNAINVAAGRTLLPAGTSTADNQSLYIGTTGLFDLSNALGIYGAGTGFNAFIGGSGIGIKSNTMAIDWGQQSSFGITNFARLIGIAEGQLRLSTIASTANAIFNPRGGEGATAGIRLEADEADDADDTWNVTATTSGTMTIANTATVLTLATTAGTWNTRNVEKQGADVASVAGAIALGTDGNAFEITGTNAITLISNVNFQNGAIVTLLFTSTATLTDGTANSGTDIGMELAGNTNFTASAGATLTLILSEIGGTQRWREKSRSVQ